MRHSWSWGPQRTALRLANIAGTSLALVASVIGTGTAGAADKGSKAPKPGQWSQVTTAGLENITDIGLARLRCS
jgi:hypothetical protein